MAFDPQIQSLQTQLAATQATANAAVTKVALMADLKSLTPISSAQIQLLAKYSQGDNLGGFYYWDSASTATEDLVYMSVIASTVSGFTTTGRWIRSFQKASKIANTNVLVNTGGVKTLYAPGTTDSTGKVVINLTTDNTSTGTAVFSEIWLVTPQQSPMTSNSGAPAIGFGVVSNDLKTCTCTFSQSNATTLGATLLAIAGTVINGLKAAPSGVAVQIKVEGS